MTAVSLQSLQVPHRLAVITTSCKAAGIALAFGIGHTVTLHLRQTQKALTPTTAGFPRPHLGFRKCVIHCVVKRPERYDATDWARALSTLPRSVVLRRIRGHIIANSTFASIIFLLYEALLRYAPDMVHHVNITPLPHTFMATAMSLLLVLRSNAAYDRFWEGRKLWGCVVNISRNIARVCASSLPKTHGDAIGLLTVCFCYALMHHLHGRREEEPFRELCTKMYIPIEIQRGSAVCVGIGGAEVEQFAGVSCVNSMDKAGGTSQGSSFCAPFETDYGWNEMRTRVPSGSELAKRINKAENKPLEVLLQLSTLIKLSVDWKLCMLQRADVCQTVVCSTNVEREKLEHCVFELMDVMGRCERIVKSPVPALWNRHTSRMISLWTLSLAFVLVPIQGVLSVPTIAVMSWVLFAVEEIGHLVEDPFRQERYSIQLEDICESIRRDVLEQVLRGCAK